MGKKFGTSFSWKRAFGVSSAKARFARATGIPTTRRGRQRKAGAAMGCMIPIVCIIGLFLFCSCGEQEERSEKQEKIVSIEKQLFNPKIDLYIFDFKDYFFIRTIHNLPAGTHATLSVKNNLGYQEQKDIVISENGQKVEIRFENKNKFNNGIYDFEIIVPISGQPENVISVFGINGELLTGNLIEKTNSDLLQIRYKKTLTIDREAEAERLKKSQEKAEKEIAYYKTEIQDMLESLLKFKNDPDFWYYGLGIGSNYNWWLKRMESLEKRIDNSPYFGTRFKTIPRELIQIGMDYIKSHGLETSYTREALKEIRKTIAETK